MINLTGTRYVDFRNTMLGDIFPYRIQQRSLKHNTLFQTISTHSLNSSTPSSNIFEFYVDSERLHKSIAAEVELFHAKSHLQKINIDKISNVDPTWKFVSCYYYGFYAATTLLRINRTGIMFLSRSNANTLQQIATSLSQSLVNIGEGAYIFSCIPVSATQTKIVLSKEGGNTHQKIWSMTFDFLNNYLNRDNTQDDEYTLLSKLLSVLRKNGGSFMSTARNRINYQGPSIIDSIEGNIFHDASCIDYNDENLFKYILSFDSRTSLSTYDIERLAYAYSSFIGNLSSKLYYEYRNRSRSTIFSSIY